LYTIFQDSNEARTALNFLKVYSKDYIRLK